MSTDADINEPLLYQYIASVPPSLEGARFDEYFPTPQHTNAELMDRYFIRQVNHRFGYITEIAQSTYIKFKTHKLYATVVIPWRIAGPVDDEMGYKGAGPLVRVVTGAKTANTLSLATAEEDMPGITRKLANVLQFHTG